MNLRPICLLAIVPTVVLSVCLTAIAQDQPLVTLTISGPETVASGNYLEIWAILTNVSTQKIEIVKGEGYAKQVLDEKGKKARIKPGFWAFAQSSDVVAIEPGQTVKEWIGDLEEYNLTKPGKYSVRVRRPLHIVDASQHATAAGALESNEITITVLPKQPHADK